MSQHQNPHRPQHPATLTIDLSMTKLGYLERWLIPHGRPVDDTDVTCWMWEHRADIKEAEGCCIERATASDYIHNQMSKQVTNRVT